VTTTQVAAPKPVVSAPASIGRAHVCGQRYYPALANRLGHQGTTTLGFTISADGGISNISVANSSGYDELDQAAVACAASWTYKPAMQNGQAVSVPWKANVKWNLNGG
jgi:protein TonB